MRAKQLKIISLSLLVSASFLIRNGSIALAGGTNERQLIFDAVEQFEAMTDYTCKLDKRVQRRGILYEDLSIAVKYRKPKQYYFRWEQGSARGREVIYVSGKYDNRLVAHPGGKMWFLTLHLDPHGRLAMRENRHSLQNSGMEKIVELIASNYKLAQEKGIDAIRCTGEDNFDGQAVWIVEGIFPPDQGFYAQKVIISIAKTIRLPVKISIFDWSGDLMEEYAFHDLRINVGLTADDFNPGNPDYNYFMGPKR